MPTASTVSKSTVAKPARKTRTRKAKPAAKQTQKSVPVAKVTVTTFKSGKAVKKVTTLKRPSTARLISWDRYLKDFQTRWAIHNFEIQELLNDFVKGFEAVKPYHAQLVKLVSK